MKDKNLCENCRTNEVERLKQDLRKCQEGSKSKDRKIKKLDKKVFVLTAIAVGIGAIFGKEALDGITEWLGSINNFKSATDNLTGHVVPSPGTLAVFAAAFLVTKPRRRRTE